MNTKNLLLVFSLFILSGCASSAYLGDMTRMEASPVSTVAPERQIIKSASIRIEVKDAGITREIVSDMVKNLSGYIEHSYDSDSTSVNMLVKVPQAQLEPFVDNVASKGVLQSKRIHSRDVTELLVDIDAKLKNLLSLRGRFRSLLDKADSVSDILDIEKELSRIQTSIDEIEGRRKSLSQQVAFSSVDIDIEQERVYGPLGYLGKGIAWAIERLFVIK